MVLLFVVLKLYSQSNGFIAAYDSMHQKVSVWYAFGEWKAIDWNTLNNNIRPKILNAASLSDTNAFYLALKEYVAAIHDGHVSIRGTGWDRHKDYARYQQIGGSYGFALTGLDNGQVVARLVNPGSPAAQAGMLFGAEIIEVNDQDVNSVLDTVSVFWAEANPATLECRRLNQFRFIGRAPLGKTIKVKFLNRGAAAPVTATFTAVDDNYATFDQTSLLPVDPGPTISYSILQPSGYGYIKLTSEPGDSAAMAQVYISFRQAISTFITAGASGMILDMRVNTGGEDLLSAALSGFFTTDTALYEYQSFYNPGSRKFELWPLPLPHFNTQTLGTYINPRYPDGALYTEPQGTLFSKPVMIMVSPRNISSGEGIPMAVRRLPGNRVVSFYGSNGSFGMIENWSYQYLYLPPDDLYFRYPVGRSLDKNMKIQVDSDSTMVGGVIPDIRVPLNDTVMDQLYTDSIDVELKYAIGKLTSLLEVYEHGDGPPGEFLEPVFPNPVHEMATLQYNIEAESPVLLSVHDSYGRLVTILVDETKKAGNYNVHWNTVNLSPGVYFCRMRTTRQNITRKCIVL